MAVKELVPPTAGWIVIPPPVAGLMPLEVIELLVTSRAELLVFGENLIPVAVVMLNPKIFTLCTLTIAPLMKLMPMLPVPAPLMVMLRRFTTMFAPLTLTPLTPPAAMIEPSVPSQSMVIDLVMVTVPKPPGSRQLISPPAAVFEIAPGKVLHGAVRLHGLASSPTPDTHVRVACASAGVACTTIATAARIGNIR